MPASHPTPIRDDVAVMLIDDHDLFRAGLRNLLESAGIRVVGDARCTAAAVAMASRVRANIVVIDGLDQLEAPTAPLIADLVRADDPPTVVVYARQARDIVVYETIRAGARAFLTKDDSVEHLIDAIDHVGRGDAWLQPSVTATVLDFIRTGLVPSPRSSAMSSREVEVLQRLAMGLDNNDIAADLGISAKTVKNHVSNIYMKLGLSNRVEAAAFAIRSGIA